MSNDIAKAIRILREGGLVAFPTETVYGLGADATKASAIAKIFVAKGRPATNPLIVHVADIDTAKKYVADWPPCTQPLAENFWPGPLTIVLPKAPSIVDEVTAGGSTVGLRCPRHPLALELLQKFNGPLAAPSANRSTRVSPTTAQHVCDELGDKVDLILDGGPCEVGIESTVLDLSGDTPTILRPGAVTPGQIRELIGYVDFPSIMKDPSLVASSPGQHLIHYAPLAATYRFEKGQVEKVRAWCEKHDFIYAILTIGTDAGTGKMPADPQEYARKLYSTFHQIDHEADYIFMEMPPDTPEWLAIRDRLMRATKPLPTDFS